MFRSALVTGGASGIGAATVSILEAEGCEVQSLDLATGFDVADPAAWDEIGPVEFAFLNAGVSTGTSIQDLSDTAYRRALGANIDGVVFGVRRMLRVMEPGGAIVATSSLAGLIEASFDPIYSLTKHAVVGFVRAVASEARGNGLTINALCPGFADTPLVDPVLRTWLAEQGIRLIDPKTVAAAAISAARSGENGKAWVVQPGREPLVYEFRGIPGPEMSVYRTPPERFESLPDFPFEPHWLDQDGLRMHYLDEGEGDPVLCLHGEPTWSYLYRKMIPVLAAHARVVAPDYFGFGRSDKPTDIAWYSFDRHCASIVRLVEELDLRELTVVVQDWGGPIGFRLAVEYPERVERLVILNTGLDGRAPSETWLRFRELVRAAGADFQAGRMVRRGVARGLADELVAAYDAPFPTPESKAGVLAFPEHVPIEPDHPNTAPLMAIREALASWEKPALVLFGDSDLIFAPEVAEGIAEWIPGALPHELVVNAGHFVQEDAGEEVAARIVEFIP